MKESYSGDAKVTPYGTTVVRERVSRGNPLRKVFP
jgi:hypothetical protein